MHVANEPWMDFNALAHRICQLVFSGDCDDPVQDKA